MVDQPRRRGIVVAFTNPVDTRTIDADHVFQILIDHDRDLNGLGLHCRCAIEGQTVPVEAHFTGTGGLITSATRSAQPLVDAVAFLLPNEPRGPLREVLARGGEFWIMLRCDFVIDRNGKAVDGEHVRAQLPSGDRPAPPDPASKLGIQGGLFESWFQVLRG
jgi:hypothetical protein